MNSKKPSTKKVIALIIIVAVLIIGVGFLIKFQSATSPMDNTVACTMEAKICPDGSSVGRTGPMCEFAMCPVPKPVTVPGWKTFTSSRVSFQYPETLGTIYITTSTWPPQISVNNNAFACNSFLNEQGQTIPAVLKTVGAHNYCISLETDAAAGSVYTTYHYSSTIQNHGVSMTFTIRSVQCVNYDDPQQSACMTERTAFNPDVIINQMMQTVVIN